MNTVGTNVLVAILAMPFLVAHSAKAQDAAPANDRQLNTDAYVKLLKTDVGAKREAIVKEIMQLSDSDAKVFWPIYQEYDGQRAKLDDSQAQLIQDYASEYQTISDEKAEQLLSKSLGIEEQRVALKKKYFAAVKLEAMVEEARRSALWLESGRL